VTKYRKKLLTGVISGDIKKRIYDIGYQYICEIIAMETDKDHVHFLISDDTTDSVGSIVKRIQQETTYRLWQKYSAPLSRPYWKRKIFCSDGCFACSIGEVSSATIQRYIETQG
jgi:putative transposase